MCLKNRRVARGGGGGGRPPPPKKKAKKKRGKGREREKKGNKVACMHVKLPPFNHFQSKIKYKFVLYEENTGHMHQIAPLTSKCKKLSLWEGGHTLPPPPPRSLRSLGLGRFASSHVIFTAPLKLNPGYATVKENAEWFNNNQPVVLLVTIDYCCLCFRGKSEHKIRNNIQRVKMCWMLKETFENTVLTAFIQNHVASLYINNLNIVNNMEIYAVYSLRANITFIIRVQVILLIPR